MTGLHVLPDSESLACATAELFARLCEASIRARGRFVVALSGGSTPRRAYELLSSREFQEVFNGAIDWEKVHLFWGDERCVPSDHADSNYRMVREALLDRLTVQPGGIYRVRTELGEPAEVARDYERQIRDCLGDQPRFDLVLLGLGAEGHTASVFADSPADAKQATAAVIAPFVPHLNAYRVSLSMGAINRAREVAFAVEGESKARILARVLVPHGDMTELPARRVKPVEGHLSWLVEKKAASRLDSDAAA